MNFVKQFLRVVWKAFFVLHFVVTLILLYPFFFILLSREKWFPIAFKLMRVWAHLLVYDTGLRYKVNYEVPLDPNRNYVFCSNHTSYLDIIFSYCVVPYYFVFMGKQELAKAPLFNVFFKKMNILVDRKSRLGSHRAFREAGISLGAGKSIILFPEGTISKEAPKMREFKNGAFKLAIENQVPIVPITFINNWKFLQDRAFLQGLSGPGVSQIIVHKPIETKGMNEEDVLTLKALVYNKIETTLLGSAQGLKKG